MKYIKRIIALVFIILIVSACHKKNEHKNFLIFGHFYGECLGETCIETFKLTDAELFEDTKDDLANSTFEFSLLNEDQFSIAKDLRDLLPEALTNEDDKTFGCPDCADGGGIYIQYAQKGEIKTWRIDQMKSNVPDYLHDFIDKINETIAALD